MSFFKRLANVVRGSVSTYGKDDPVQSAAERAALDRDLGNPTPSQAAHDRLAAMKSVTPEDRATKTQELVKATALRSLAARYDEGDLTRDEYDRERTRLIHGEDGPPARTL
jgi:hypothetical protein